ncbi:MAG: Mut7-C ubiquitin/RNAse domain-containing protein [Bacteroidales bacterium]|nr:Mut7-C ubiquitin/RNAse domain-containing protein [Bacteroidales bacterium]
MPATAYFRFYEELNDFLSQKRKKSTFSYTFFGTPTVKDVIEAIGVPHTEVDLILANGESVSFFYKPGNNDHISVYPVFESIDIKDVTRLRPEPLRKIKFILDVHLGKLARYLRMSGFDTLYQNDFEDQEIIRLALKEKRIILTRDIGILKNGSVTHGYFIRSDRPARQINEVIQRFDLKNCTHVSPRCIECNGIIQSADKESVLALIPENTRKYFHAFFQCNSCGRVYWEGSHNQVNCCIYESSPQGLFLPSSGRSQGPLHPLSP